jgi:hypothetical protein
MTTASSPLNDASYTAAMLNNRLDGLSTFVGQINDRLRAMEKANEIQDAIPVPDQQTNPQVWAMIAKRAAGMAARLGSAAELYAIDEIFSDTVMAGLISIYDEYMFLYGICLTEFLPEAFPLDLADAFWLVHDEHPQMSSIGKFISCLTNTKLIMFG